MKHLLTLEKFELNEKYTTRYDMPAFEKNVILKALRAYIDNPERKRNEGNGCPDVEQLQHVIDYIESGKITP